jgi:8-oxo-dGTP pyrophosphatase MutT (NUDIX family)
MTLEKRSSAEDSIVRAAGVLCIADGKVLLLHRTKDKLWGLPGGKIEDGETPLDAALRECDEETGYRPAKATQFDYSNDGIVEFTTFIHTDKEPFTPKLNSEHSEYMWVDWDNLPNGVHPKVGMTLDKYRRIRIGMDVESKRETDTNGWIEVKDNPISKVGIFPYRGYQLGKEYDPDKTYQVYRPEEELNDPECLDSFKLLPWVDDHTMLGPEGSGFTPAEEKGVQGVTGEEIYFRDGTLYANLKLFSNALADLI